MQIRSSISRRGAESWLESGSALAVQGLSLSLSGDLTWGRRLAALLKCLLFVST